jgi:hypothetical protein
VRSVCWLTVNGSYWLLETIIYYCRLCLVTFNYDCEYYLRTTCCFAMSARVGLPYCVIRSTLYFPSCSWKFFEFFVTAVAISAQLQSITWSGINWLGSRYKPKPFLVATSWWCSTIFLLNEYLVSYFVVAVCCCNERVSVEKAKRIGRAYLQDENNHNSNSNHFEIHWMVIMYFKTPT